nr:MAG TPA: hypothetical protein [Caudoviricetes sp.]
MARLFSSHLKLDSFLKFDNILYLIVQKKSTF